MTTYKLNDIFEGFIKKNNIKNIIDNQSNHLFKNSSNSIDLRGLNADYHIDNFIKVISRNFKKFNIHGLNDGTNNDSVYIHDVDFDDGYMIMSVFSMEGLPAEENSGQSDHNKSFALNFLIERKFASDSTDAGNFTGFKIKSLSYTKKIPHEILDILYSPNEMFPETKYYSIDNKLINTIFDNQFLNNDNTDIFEKIILLCKYIQSYKFYDINEDFYPLMNSMQKYLNIPNKFEFLKFSYEYYLFRVADFEDLINVYNNQVGIKSNNIKMFERRIEKYINTIVINNVK